VADSRELSSTVPRELLEFGVVSKPKMLDVGDYLISDRACVERKTAEDFIASMLDGRLMEQMKNLNAYSRPCLIIEGEGLYSKRGVHPNAIRGALASIALDFRIPIIFTQDERDTAAIIAAMIKREHLGEKRDVQIRPDKRRTTQNEQQESIVAGLPNVNIVLARRLLLEFETVQKIFNATQEELERVQGIGKKTAEEIVKILKEKYGKES
jgi:Fanconi anemia group M protein